MKFALSDLRVSSPAFKEAGRIPAKHTGEAEDTSPPLEWSAVPRACWALGRDISDRDVLGDCARDAGLSPTAESAS